MQILERIRQWVQTAPDRIAYQTTDSRLTYGALWRQSGYLASRLREEPCPRFLLWGGKEPELPVAILACLRAGKTYVPVSDTTPPLRLSRIREELGACRILCAAEKPDADSLRIEDLLRDVSDPAAEEAWDSELPAYIIFTSGSTGAPKGVPISRENLDHFANWICGLPYLNALRSVRVLNQAAFSFDLSVADFYYALCGGHTLCAMPTALQADPAAALDFWQISDPEAAVCTPTFLKLCLLEQSFCAQTLPRLQIVYACGEVLEPLTAGKLLERFPGLILYNAYGPTEATSAVCAVRITRELAERGGPLPVGRLDTAACGIEIEQDEVVLRGKSVFSGYLNGEPGGSRGEEGRPCYHTGDLGYIRDGLLYLRGRRDRQIKWKGYRIELDEIETELAALKGVDACAVIARKTSDGGVRFMKAFLVTDRDPEDIRRELTQRLPTYMIPKVFVKLDKLPVNANGKTDRMELSRL